MLGSITPLGERGRRAKWHVTATSYVLGSALGGAAIGAALGALGGVAGLGESKSVNYVFYAAAAIVAFSFDLGLIRLPSARRQVNENWMNLYRGWVYGIAYGMQLGLGVVTIVTSSIVYLAFIGALLSGSWFAGALIGGTFGLVRAAPIVLVRGVRHPDDVIKVGKLLQRWEPAASRAAHATNAIVAVACVAVFMSTEAWI